MAAEPNDGYKIISDNRQARHEYEILETFETGLELLGSEVKSIRQGKVNLKDGFALIREGEIWLHNVHISPHETTNKAYNHDAKRTRKLLMRRDEIRKLIGKVEQQGLTLVPLKLYLKRGWIKLNLALVRGKKLHDKRESLKRREAKREIDRAMKQF